ncbi:glycosyltransferase family 4 protein, partial [Patescibacteria group bacterium]|nr:glycosyltransferase family 4 protein [Patescibacteria group bacterium]
DIIRIGFGKRWDKFLLPLFGFFKALWLMREHRPDLFWGVMATYASGIPFMLKIARPFLRTPILLTLQEGDSEEHIRKNRFGLIYLSWRLALKRADSLQAISTYLGVIAQKYGYRGKVHVIPNGVDVTNFTREFLPDELKLLRETIGIKPEEKVLITASRLAHKNAVDSVVRSLAIFKKEHPDAPIKFLILGSGEEAERIRHLAKELGVLEYIIFAGSVSHAELPKYLKMSDVFIRPSRSEGLGNAFIEAMAAGIPVIGTPIGGITDFLISPKQDARRATGIFVKVDDPADIAQKVFLLLNDEALRQQLVERAKKTVAKNYNWEGIAGQFQNLFSETIRESLKKRVLIATGIFPPDAGGPATYGKLLLESLPHYDIAPRVVSYGTASAISEAGRVTTVSRALPKGLRHIAYFGKIFFRAPFVDVIFAQDTVSAGLPALCAAKFLQKRFALKITGDYAWEQGMSRFRVSDSIDDFQRNKYSWRVEMLRAAEHFVSRRADVIIVPSEYLKTIVRGWGVAENRISVIYNAVSLPSPETAKLSKKEVREKLGLSGIILVSIGRLVAWKGFSALIQAMPNLIKEFPDMQLLIIGDGPEKERLALQLRDLCMENYVILKGNLPHDEVLLYLRACDAFVLNTAYEGFSHQIIEAMAMGAPVIATDSGGNKEILRDHENALVIERDVAQSIVNAVTEVLRDSMLAQKLALRAEKTVEEFTEDIMIKKLLAVLF